MELSTEPVAQGIRALAALLGEPSASAPWEDFQRGLAEDRRSALATLARAAQLTPFDLKVLVALLGFQLEPDVASLFGLDPAQVPGAEPTVGLLLQLLCTTLEERLHARARLSPVAPLRRRQLVALSPAAPGPGDRLLSRRVTVESSVLRYLLGEHELPDALRAVARFGAAPQDLLGVVLPPSYIARARELLVHHGRVLRALQDWGLGPIVPQGRGAVLLFSGPSGTGKTLLARALATDAGRPLLTVTSPELPPEGAAPLLRALFTEARMTDAVLLFEDCEGLLARTSPHLAATLAALDEADEAAVILTTNRPDLLAEPVERRILLHLPLEPPDASARRQIWEIHLPPGVPLAEDVDLDVLADQFELTGGQIKNAVLVAANRALTEAAAAPRVHMRHLTDGAASQLRNTLGGLTRPTRTTLRVRDIVLPDDARARVEELLAAIRNQASLMNAWGLRERLVTGRGIVALFDGPPGTGKTLTAEVIAGEVGQTLHRVNLASVVSKWVGETEKHIQEIFQAARASHAMLLFDEADALFSARTEESHGATDRYANMEVNLLLQEVERFPGVVILTTNFYGRLDKALLRRILFRVRFDKPSRQEQERIWTVLCPTRLPLAPDVDFAKLTASFDLTGGHIKNALLRAAYAARRAGKPVTQDLLEEACRGEYKAAGRVTRDPAAVARDRAARAARLAEVAREPPSPGGVP